jgi:hypothetical protein
MRVKLGFVPANETRDTQWRQDTGAMDGSADPRGIIRSSACSRVFWLRQPWPPHPTYRDGGTGWTT